jgi:hypothetical protein
MPTVVAAVLVVHDVVARHSCWRPRTAAGHGVRWRSAQRQRDLRAHEHGCSAPRHDVRARVCIRCIIHPQAC